MTITPSATDKLYILLKAKFLVGTFFLLCGALLSVVFISKSDLKSFSYFNKELIEAKAVITDIKTTNSSINEQSILEFHYRFLEHDQTQIGTSYSAGYNISVEDTVLIEFVQNDLSTSRIVGMTNAPFGLYATFFVLIFPLLGLIFIIYELKDLRKCINILGDFSITTGKLLSKKASFSDTDDHVQYIIEYKYQHHKTQYTNNFTTVWPKKFKKTETLIISNLVPEESILLKHLPKTLRTKIKNSSKNSF